MIMDGITHHVRRLARRVRRSNSRPRRFPALDAAEEAKFSRRSVFIPVVM